MTEAKHESEVMFTKELAGELWGVFCEDLVEIDRVLTAPPCITV